VCVYGHGAVVSEVGEQLGRLFGFVAVAKGGRKRNGGEGRQGKEEDRKKCEQPRAIWV